MPMKKFLRKAAEIPYRLNRVERLLSNSMMLQAAAEVRHVQGLGALENLQEAEFRVFSQWGEDGIIQYLIHRLGIRQKRFVEFGVESYRESNTRFLLLRDRWSGLVLDGSSAHMKTLERDYLPWLYDLHYEAVFITRENINDIIRRHGFDGPLGILSVDIDGNDYWVWEAIDCVDADIVIAEYNAALGPERAVSVPYKPDFVASSAHYSGQYFGASLAALTHLAHQKGYYLAGTTSAGNNAFFLRPRYRELVPERRVEEVFTWPHWRQAREQSGVVSNKSFQESLHDLKGLSVVNVISGEMENI